MKNSNLFVKPKLLFIMAQLSYGVIFLNPAKKPVVRYYKNFNPVSHLKSFEFIAFRSSVNNSNNLKGRFISFVCPAKNKLDISVLNAIAKDFDLLLTAVFSDNNNSISKS